MSDSLTLPAPQELLSRFKKVILVPIEGFCELVSQASKGKQYDPTEFAAMLVRTQINFCQGKHPQFFVFLKTNMPSIIDAFVDDREFAAKAKDEYARQSS